MKKEKVIAARDVKYLATDFCYTAGIPPTKESRMKAIKAGHFGAPFLLFRTYIHDPLIAVIYLELTDRFVQLPELDTAQSLRSALFDLEHQVSWDMFNDIMSIDLNGYRNAENYFHPIFKKNYQPLIGKHLF